MSTFELISLIIGIVLLIARLILAIGEGWKNDWMGDTFRGEDDRTATGMSWPRPSNDQRNPERRTRSGDPRSGRDLKL